jgi:hypothetical protein
VRSKSSSSERVVKLQNIWYIINALTNNELISNYHAIPISNEDASVDERSELFKESLER